MTSAIIEILIENAGLVNLVGHDQGQVKIYPTQAPQGAREPYVTVSEVSLNPSLGKGCPSDLDGPRYNILVYSLDFRKTELIQQQIRATLGTGEGFTTDVGARFDQIWMVDRQDLFMPGNGQERGMYVKAGIYECRVR